MCSSDLDLFHLCWDAFHAIITKVHFQNSHPYLTVKAVKMYIIKSRSGSVAFLNSIEILHTDVFGARGMQQIMNAT